MSLKSLCRVCLATNVQSLTILDTPLQQIYEKIANIPLCSEGKPVVVCSICFTQLKRCYNLMTRAVQADFILNQVARGEVQLSEAHPFCRHVYTVSPIVIVEIGPEEAAVKEELPVKLENKCEDVEENIDTVNHEEANEPDNPSSDSEDDVPLNKISIQNRTEKKTRVKVRKKQCTQKKEGRGFTADFAKEILLSKEQQLHELQQRASSLNYLNSPLKCERCYKGFVDSRAFENHMAKHDESSGAWACDVCALRYESARQLRSHARSAHARRYQCARCSHASHTANQAREHERWHAGYTYECKLCGQAFRKPTSYLTHVRKRHPSPHVCSLCGDSFVGRHGLRMHLSKAHRRQETATSESPATEETRDCAVCGLQLQSAAAWLRHVLAAHASHADGGSCAVCGLRCGGAALAPHLRLHARALRPPRPAAAPAGPARPATLACEQCGASFPCRSRLRAHGRRVHEGLRYNKNIVCELCGKKCTSNASLTYHQRTHTGERPFKCGACPKGFADSNQLRIHSRTHTGERPYCCAVCGKRFSQKPALNRHYRVHTGAKPYSCQFCSKPFSQSNSLKLHERTVHLKLPPKAKGAQGAQPPAAAPTDVAKA